MARKQAMDETDVVGNEKTESKTQQTGGDRHAAIELRESPASVGKRDSNGGGNEHHAGNCPYAKYEEISC